MGYRNFRFVCTLRVLILCGTAFVFTIALNRSEFIIINVFLGIIILYQTYLLIRYVEKTNRDLARFIEAIKYEDSSRSFSSKGRGSSFDTLSSAFSGVAKEIRHARSEKEEQYRYLQTVIQHIGTGLISFQQDGEVELINTAAKKLINVSNIKNIKALQALSKPLVDTLFGMKSGERALIAVDVNGRQMQLAIFATEFRMREKKFTLASIQNIQSELERERMVKELEIAHEVQMSLLPKGSPRISGFDIAGICIPAEEVGGDYYDFIDLGDKKLGIAVGDVSGKGLPAAIYMTLTKGIIQSQAEERLSPKEVLTKINALLYQSIERKAFVSMFYTVVDTEKRRLVCSRAGHNPAIYIRAGQDDFSLIEPSGIGLGLERGDVFQKVIREKEIKLQKGDLFIVHTDGFTEAMNKNYNEYGEERLVNIIRENMDKSSKELIEAVSQDVRKFRQTHPQHDDMTMVSMRVN